MELDVLLQVHRTEHACWNSDGRRTAQLPIHNTLGIPLDLGSNVPSGLLRRVRIKALGRARSHLRADIQDGGNARGEQELADMVVDLAGQAVRALLIANRSLEHHNFPTWELNLFELQGNPCGSVLRRTLLDRNDDRVLEDNGSVIAKLIEDGRRQLDLHLPRNVAIDCLQEPP